jgi:hypothetical protein
VLVAREAAGYALASSDSAGSRAAQARASTTEQPQTERSFACRPGEPGQMVDFVGVSRTKSPSFCFRKACEAC